MAKTKSSTKKIEKWEFQVVNFAYAMRFQGLSPVAAMNMWGSDGWELVNADNENAYFERPLVDAVNHLAEKK